ncbi:unnamed protein product [Closterium sp. NIES-64]|nr:unnamed protein product [Closterium sp. NIES-64]
MSSKIRFKKGTSLAPPSTPHFFFLTIAQFHCYSDVLENWALHAQAVGPGGLDLRREQVAEQVRPAESDAWLGATRLGAARLGAARLQNEGGRGGMGGEERWGVWLGEGDGGGDERRGTRGIRAVGWRRIGMEGGEERWSGK